MDIRTKLVFTLVAVSLGSMFAVGAVAYTAASALLQENTLRQLDALAESKEEDLENVVQGWRDRVNLIASRTHLRLSLATYGQTGSPEQRRQIQRIIADAGSSVETLRELTVFDASGGPVASLTRPDLERVAALKTSRLSAGADHPIYRGIAFEPNGSPRVEFIAPLLLDGERIGWLQVTFIADELLDVAANFTGLGETGETLIVVRDPTGRPRIAHPVRHARAVPDLSDPGPGDEPAALAIRGEEGVFAQGLTDYRGEPVWAATRYLPGVDWGLVVKFDAAEEHAPILELRRRLTRVGLSLSAFAVLLGTVLGLWFARPIHGLAEAANRIRQGDLSARAEHEPKDEVGLLARTFNEMAEELEHRMGGSGGPGPDDDGA